jgi:metabolite-proton symporter
MMGRRQPNRVIVASLIGTSLEWYDFFLYGTAAALVFGPLFFPEAGPLTGTLLAFATHWAGFLARPIGAVVFGHFGDRVGRKNVLAVTLLLMGLSTFLIGLLPTYTSIGVAAPLLLVVLRFVQGLSVGGEWGGAVLMAIEHGDPGRRGLSASWPQVGVPIGSMLSAGTIGLANLSLSDSAFMTWGWRLPFLLSGVLALVGLWIRRTIAESPMFAQVPEPARTPVREVVRTHPRALVTAFCSKIGADVAYYVFTLYVLTYLTGTVGLTRHMALNAVLIASAAQVLLLPLFGALSDRIGRRPLYLAGAIGAAAWIFAFFPLLDSASFAVIALAVGVGLLTHTAMLGPMGAFFAELFGTRVRYSGTSLGSQAAGVAGGALAPIVSIALLDRFGDTIAISLYVTAALAVSALGLLIAPKPVEWTSSGEAGTPPATSRVGRRRHQASP